MRLLFLTIGKRTTPSTRFRVKQYIGYLQEDGIECDIKHIPHAFFKRFFLLYGLGGYDAVVIQKKLFSAFELSLLIRSNKNIIYDFDDLVTVEHPMHDLNDKVKNKMTRNMERFTNTLRSVCGVIAGNSFLKEIALIHNRNVAIVPTPVEMYRLPAKEVSDTEHLTIGWIGTKSNLFYLDRLKPVFAAISKKFPNASLKIVCNAPYECDEIKVVNKEWRVEDETDDLLSFDIGIMPLTDDDWSRGKCGFKLLQYMAVGLPTVASAIGTNGEIIESGVNGFLADSKDAWVDKLSLLLDFSGTREKIGTNAREYVNENYSTRVCKDKLIDAIRKFIAG